MGSIHKHGDSMEIVQAYIHFLKMGKVGYKSQ
jgi:hypothetical protein